MTSCPLQHLHAVFGSSAAHVCAAQGQPIDPAMASQAAGPSGRSSLSSSLGLSDIACIAAGCIALHQPLCCVPRGPSWRQAAHRR